MSIELSLTDKLVLILIFLAFLMWFELSLRLRRITKRCPSYQFLAASWALGSLAFYGAFIGLSEGE